MTISITFETRKKWIPPDERPTSAINWRRVPWWKPEVWFYRSSRPSYWGTGIGWLWVKIRLGGG